MAAPRKIIHIDMDAFYASVERKLRPETVGKPLVVGGDPDRRGVVASASYEARRFGIRSAMSSRHALRLCPHAIFVAPDMARYKAVSREIQSLFHEVTELVEPLSLDEAYLDVTRNKWNEPLARNIARRLRASIEERFGLTASAGVGPNKFIAKLASDLRKPNALVVVPPEKVLSFLEPMPVERLWGVGPATAKRLHALGLRSVSDLRKVSREKMFKVLGRFGLFVHDLAHGIDDRPVDTDLEPKSRGSETTFERDQRDPRVLEGCLKELADDVSRSLVKHSRRGRTITLKLRYADFKTITRRRTLPRSICDAQTIREVAVELLHATDAGKVPVRLLGISVGQLQHPNDPLQLQLEI